MGNPLAGIEVRFAGLADTTDAAGDYVIDSASAGVTGGDGAARPATWGSIKAMRLDNADDTRKSPQNPGASVQTYTDSILVNCGDGKDQRYWSARCGREITGPEYVFDAVLPKISGQTPTGRQGDLTVEQYKDMWDIIPNGWQYQQYMGWGTSSYPIEVFADWTSLSEELWNSIVTQLNVYELEHNIDLFTPMEYGYIAEGYPTSGNWIAVQYGSPSCNTYVGSDAWVDRGILTINTTTEKTILHEIWRSLTGNNGCAVTTWSPSNFKVPADPKTDKDWYAEDVSLQLLQRNWEGVNDIKDTEYFTEIGGHITDFRPPAPHLRMRRWATPDFCPPHHEARTTNLLHASAPGAMISAWEDWDGWWSPEWRITLLSGETEDSGPSLPRPITQRTSRWRPDTAHFTE